MGRWRVSQCYQKRSAGWWVDANCRDFDAVMKGMSNIHFGATNRKSKLICFVNPTLLWSANWSWMKTELAESVVTVKQRGRNGCASFEVAILPNDLSCCLIIEMLRCSSSATARTCMFQIRPKNECWIFMILRKTLHWKACGGLEYLHETKCVEDLKDYAWRNQSSVWTRMLYWHLSIKARQDMSSTWRIW